MNVYSSFVYKSTKTRCSCSSGDMASCSATMKQEPLAYWLIWVNRKCILPREWSQKDNTLLASIYVTSWKCEMIKSGAMGLFCAFVKIRRTGYTREFLLYVKICHILAFLIARIWKNGYGRQTVTCESTLITCEWHSHTEGGRDSGADLSHFGKLCFVWLLWGQVEHYCV